MTLTPNGKVSEVWKSLAMFLMGVTLAGVVGWGTYIRTAVDRNAMEQYVTNNSPYARDKSGIDAKLSNIQEQLKELKISVDELRGDQRTGKKLRRGD